MIPTDLKQLLDHMEWADARVWDAVLELPAAGGDDRLRLLLHHVHAVQWAYLHLWRREPLDLREADAFADLAALRRWGRDYFDAAAEFLATLDAASLEHPLDVPWAAQLEERFGTVYPLDLRQSVIQIALHTAHHRGQVNTRIRELGGEPPLVDFAAWVWMGKPAG